MEIIIMTFLFRLLDNAFGTLKTIYLAKEKYMYSSLLNTVSTFFYLVALSNVMKDSGPASIAAMCAATFLGTLLPSKVVQRLEKDKLYVYEITTDGFEAGLEFADCIRELNIPIKTTISYDTNLNKVLTCKAYCSSKAESAILKDMIPTEYKHHAYAAKEY